MLQSPPCGLYGQNERHDQSGAQNCRYHAISSVGQKACIAYAALLTREEVMILQP
jgi:hypothetical protein